MKLIAVVGKSGSGKTHFSKLLVECFCDSFSKTAIHLDIDKIGHEVLTDSKVAKNLQCLFGKKILDEYGKISRKKLSDVVFSNKDSLNILNMVTLPKMKEIINEVILENLDKDYIILDYALLPSISEYFKACHYKILVEADIEVRRKRILNRDNITKQKFENRDKASLTYNYNDFDVVIKSITKLDFDTVPIINKYAYATCFNLVNSKATKAYYPGSFDPITYGHIDIIQKTLDIGFDKVIIAITPNSSKKTTMFSLEERYKMIKELFKTNPKVEVITVETRNASVKVAKKYNCSAMIRGLRNVTDFEYELDLSKVNSTLSNVETLFLTASHKYDFVSSSITRELAYLSEDISFYVPPLIEKYVKEKVKNRNNNNNNNNNN